jgi:hypothetical protein
MMRVRTFVGRLLAMVGSRKHERDLDDEVASHLAEAQDEYIKRGFSREDARLAAARDFGGITQTKQIHREIRSVAWFHDLSLDVKYAARRVFKAPGFAVVYVATLGMGIGAATAIFSVLNGVLIKPLPYPEPDSLVSIWNTSHASNDSGVMPLSATQFFTYTEENRTFSAFGLWTRATATVTAAEPEEIQTLLVTDGTLQALGVPPAIGRWFSPDDTAPRSPEAVILTDAYWHRRFGGDVSAIGRTLTVDAPANNRRRHARRLPFSERKA